MKVSGSSRDTVSVGPYTMINSSLDNITAYIGSTVVASPAITGTITEEMIQEALQKRVLLYGIPEQRTSGGHCEYKLH